MQALFASVKTPLKAWLKETPTFFLQPLRLLKNYKRENLRPDLVAGLTVAVVLLPQAIAYALIAELPPDVGLYSAVVTTIVAALWGSSAHLHTGPTNAASLVVLSTLLNVSEPGTPEFLIAAGVMSVMAGVIKLLMGLFRLGALVYFVSDSVIIGFTAGAGVLISVGQLRSLLRISVPPSPYFFVTLRNVILQLLNTHWQSLAIGVFTMVVIVLVKRYAPKLPSALLAMVLASVLVFLFGLDAQGVSVLGAIPRGLPPFRALPLGDFDLLNALTAGASAGAVIGLMEAMSIARALAGQTGQRLDTNQEFIGQGLANIVSGFFSGYSGSGSFTRSAMNLAAGARTQFAAAFAGLFILVAVFAFGPLVAYLPRPALAGVLLVTAFMMVDTEEIRRTIESSPGDTLIMAATFFACLFLKIEYAILAGVFVSFVRYVQTTSTPEVSEVTPDAEFSHFEINDQDGAHCPQLGVITIQGGLYFGAVRHVEDEIRAYRDINPSHKFLMLRMHRVNHIDMTGIHMLETLVRLYRQDGGDVFMVNVHTPVIDRMSVTGFDMLLGPENFLPSEAAIAYVYHRILHPAICIYGCQERVWKECQTLPKTPTAGFVPLHALVAPDVDVPSISAEELAKRLYLRDKVMLIDIREPAEWDKDGFIPDSLSVPLPKFSQRKNNLQLPPDHDIVFVCRSGRRSRHLTSQLQAQGWENVAHLRGGLLAWRNAYLPVETPERQTPSPTDTVSANQPAD